MMPPEPLPAWATHIAALAPYQYHLIAASVVAMIVLEWIAPRRSAPASTFARWLATFSIALLGYAIAMLVGPTLQNAILVPLAALGLPNLERLSLPLWASLAIAVIILDAITYATHRLFHAVPLFWRAHKVHHSDPHMDASTGLLHHPFESILSLTLQLILIGLLGLPLIAVLLYALLHAVHNAFTHANLYVPEPLERWVRLLVITPDMHRIHHSVQMDEGNSNFGAILPWWDHVFGTYCASPRSGQEDFRLGLETRDGAPPLGFGDQIMMPFEPTASKAPAKGAHQNLQN